MSGSMFGLFSVSIWVPLWFRHLRLCTPNYFLCFLYFFFSFSFLAGFLFDQCPKIKPEGRGRQTTGSIDIPQSDDVIGNQVWSPSLRLDWNWKLYPDQGTEFIIIIIIMFCLVARWSKEVHKIKIRENLDLFIVHFLNITKVLDQDSVSADTQNEMTAVWRHKTPNT